MPHQIDLIFGLSPMIVASIILVISYSFIITERINRAVVALLGASLMIYTGVLNQHLAIEGIDFNTIFLLIGMMVIVTMTKNSGLFQFVAIYAAKIVKGNPRSLLVMLALITAVFSALLDNVTTVLLVVPITLLLTEQLKLKPYAFLFTIIFSSNIGGAATLIGDPPNILIGSAAGLGFLEFVVNIGPLSVVNMIILLIFTDFIWGRNFQTSMRARAHLLRYDPFEALNDIALLFKSLFVLALVISGFVVGHNYGIEPGTIALSGAALLLLLDVGAQNQHEQSRKVQEYFSEVEWETVFFFIGLFILVYGVEHTGLLSLAAKELLKFTEGSVLTTAMAILWSSALLSAIVDNIPFVATMIPLIESLQADMGGEEAIRPLWWALSMGACFGGNGSLIGASANVMVASFAQRAGQHIPFLKFMALAFPLMLVSIFISTFYAWVVYF